MKKLKKKINIKTIILLVYMIFTLIITLNHEPWRDEAQAWLIAKNLNPLEIILQMKYEGHPCLWHLILYPFAKLNFPYQIINIISWALACISATIIIKKSPFPIYTNIAFLLSYPILYQYTVISRSYSLILLFIAILISIFHKRKEKPILYGTIIALLANTHILVAGLIGALILIDFYELIKEQKNRKKRTIGLTIEIVGVILLFLQLISSLSSNTETKLNSSNNQITIINSFINIFKQITIDNYILFLTCIISFIGIFFTRKKQNLFILILGIGFPLLVNTFIYPFGLQHIGVILLIILFVATILEQKNNNQILKLSILILFSTTIPLSIGFNINELTNNYSNAKDTAIYISKHIKEGSNFLCTHDAYTESIIPYLNNTYKFFYPNTEKEFTYVTWSKERYNSKSYNDLKRIINEKNITHIIHSFQNYNIEIKNLEIEGKIKKIKTFEEFTSSNERYQIFEIVKE